MITNNRRFSYFSKRRQLFHIVAKCRLRFDVLESVETWKLCFASARIDRQNCFGQAIRRSSNCSKGVAAHIGRKTKASCSRLFTRTMWQDGVDDVTNPMGHILSTFGSIHCRLRSVVRGRCNVHLNPCRINNLFSDCNGRRHNRQQVGKGGVHVYRQYCRYVASISNNSDGTANK